MAKRGATSARTEDQAADRPTLDIDHLRAIQRQGIDVLMASNRLILHSLQMFMRKQMDLFDHNSGLAVDALASLATLPLNDGTVDKRHAGAIAAEMRAYREAVSAGSRQCFESISERAAASLDDLQAVLTGALDRIGGDR